MNVWSLHQTLSFLKERLCCMYDGITIVSCILSFFTIIKHLVQTYTLNSCNVGMKILENKPHSSIGRPHSFSKDHAGKNTGFRPGCSTPSTIFARSCTKRFLTFLLSTKCSEWQKIFSRRSSKNIYGKLLELKTSWILLERNQQATW